MIQPERGAGATVTGTVADSHPIGLEL